MPISVLLVDDHIPFRKTLRVLLEDITDLSVVGEASDGVEALALAESLRPDVVVMDGLMPQLNGWDATARLHQQQPATRVIMLSSCDKDDMVRAAIKNGVSGYVLKEDFFTHLPLAIAAAAAEKPYFSPGLFTRNAKPVDCVAE